jgi:hypothetical protein
MLGTILGAIITVGGMTMLGIWMYKRGYKDGYYQAVKDSDNFYVMSVKK